MDNHHNILHLQKGNKSKPTISDNHDKSAIRVAGKKEAIKINEHTQMINLIQPILMKSSKKSSILKARAKGIKKPKNTKIKPIISE